MKDKRLLYIAMAIAVPLASEIKFFSLAGDLRVSLGTPVFFFLLLWLKNLFPIWAGLFTGMAVFAVRMTMEWFTGGFSDFEQTLLLHYPVIFYYFIFACQFQLFKIRSRYHTPITIGWLGAAADTIASAAEIMIRSFSMYEPIPLQSFLVIGVVAVASSFIVVGFFYVIFLREIKTAQAIQKQSQQQELVNYSYLYVEMFQLKHSMDSAEELTRDCYQIYRKLKSEKQFKTANQVLAVAGKIHEIKKNNQRIHAGITKLMIEVNLSDFMHIKEIVHIAVSSHQNYSDMLGKSIVFRTHIKETHPPYQAISLLSIINNLLSNAVEAIDEAGTITLSIDKFQTHLALKVTDDGCGIPPKNLNLVFQPGFTTKFDQTGKASNGIGLSYVKRMIEDHGGTIHLVDRDQSRGTTFNIYIPMHRLIESEWKADESFYSG